MRIPEAERVQFTPRVLAALLTANSPGSRPHSAVRPAQRLEDLRVTLLSPAEVKLLDVLLTQLDERRRLAEQELELITELCDITTGGLVDGTLIMSDNLA